ncbi:MAG: PHP domain-containing protein, partial [Clostridiales bacterium]|nr:PHP domain-containing protein [Clostridiales bacterium]
MKISIHIHSEYSSDSKLPIAAIIEESRKLGYDAIAITDHNTVAGSMAARDMLRDDISVITGAEFSTEKGHILALFIDDTIEKSCRMNDSRPGRTYDFNGLVSKVRDQGGLLFLAHPIQSLAPQDHSFIKQLDGYERINGRINSSHKDKKADRLSRILEAAYPDKIR